MLYKFYVYIGALSSPSGSFPTLRDNGNHSLFRRVFPLLHPQWKISTNGAMRCFSSLSLSRENRCSSFLGAVAKKGKFITILNASPSRCTSITYTRRVGQTRTSAIRRESLALLVLLRLVVVESRKGRRCTAQPANNDERTNGSVACLDLGYFVVVGG